MLLIAHIGSMPILRGSAVRITDQLIVTLRLQAMLMEATRASSPSHSRSHPAPISRTAR